MGDLNSTGNREHLNMENEIYSRVFKFSPTPIMVIDCSSIDLIYINSSFCKQFHTQDCVNPSSRLLREIFNDQFNCLVFDICSEDGNASFPIHFKEIKIEKYHPNDWDVSLWLIPKKGLVGSDLVIELTDMTERTQAREKLTAMNQQLLIGSVGQHEIASFTKELNRQLHEASEAKNQFIAVMNHEIRTPLNAIIGFSDLMVMDNLDEADRIEFSERIKRNGKVLLHLIEDLLDLSKIEADRLVVETGVVNLIELLGDTHSIMVPIALKRGIFLGWTIDPTLPQLIESDAIRIKQILTNIIGNAIKFTAYGYVKVFVSWSMEKSLLTVTVEDSGEGISPEQKEKLFQPFAQADSSITRRFGGTGLGLHLSRRIARALGGDLELVESRPSLGSTFSITLPIVLPRDDGLPEQARSEPPHYDLKGLRILLVEDAPDNQLLLAHVFSESGCEIMVADDGQKAVNEVFRRPYDLVLMDIGMPVMDGITATQIMRERGYQGAIIALTAHAMKDEVEESLEAGCDAHVSKPVDFQQLLKTIQAVVKDPVIGSTIH